MSGWVEWHGGECPLPPMTPVRLRYRGAEAPSLRGRRITAAPAIRMDWSHDGGPDDIIAYQVWDPTEGARS